MKKPLFTLIVATLGRERELDSFLDSVSKQTIDLSEIQIVIVDQNSDIDLEPVINQYQNRLHILHMRSPKPGLSHNRNLGLDVAKGQIVAFPDDDCLYYPDTLDKVREAFRRNPTSNLILGRIVDRSTGKPMLRKWPTSPKIVSRMNFLTYYSSITIFAKNCPYFDERLGVGTYFGSYEDADFVYSVLLRDKGAIYDPTIEVWHEEQNMHVFNEIKIWQYGLGFGALTRKHLSFVMVYWLLGVLTYHTLGLLRAFLRSDSGEVRKRWLSIASRIQGFLRFPRTPEN
ncbi:glycosyltransferase family 2 protein [Meiothermus sp. CFH 77666]|uniref:glycosyltransferase family 2 protein n=1 Tax=Meiothermus sp. CFH 77666 TaxID=2817942 RepID=UPI001AA05BB6|nr:glycosyltransferase family 2 protein [Meiothermus sp. CFH 77666]MBO1436373.1 glycosyltransferase family 2 protein [Meiothermus sp. CFH 77666]